MDLSTLPAFEVKDPAKWREISATLNREHYGEIVLRFTALWAQKMERQLSNGVSLRSCAEKMASEVEEELGGTRDFVYGYAAETLKQIWKHGEEIARICNL